MNTKKMIGYILLMIGITLLILGLIVLIGYDYRDAPVYFLTSIAVNTAGVMFVRSQRKNKTRRKDDNDN